MNSHASGLQQGGKKDEDKEKGENKTNYKLNYGTLSQMRLPLAVFPHHPAMAISQSYINRNCSLQLWIVLGRCGWKYFIAGIKIAAKKSIIFPFL